MTRIAKLYLRIRSLTLGRTTAEYPLEGSAAAFRRHSPDVR